VPESTCPSYLYNPKLPALSNQRMYIGTWMLVADFGMEFFQQNNLADTRSGGRFFDRVRTRPFWNAVALVYPTSARGRREIKAA